MVQLSSENAQILFRLGRKSCKDNRQWNTKFLYFAHMIYESQHFNLFHHLLECFCDKGILSLKDHKLSQFDCKVLAHFLCSIQHKWKKLDLQNCSLNVQSLHVFDHVYQTNTAGSVTFESIDISSNNPRMIDKLKSFPWFSGVQEFKFHCKDSGHSVGESIDLRCLAHIPNVSIVHGSPYTETKYESPYQRTNYGVRVILTGSKINVQHKVILGECFVNCLEFKEVKKIELTGVEYRTVQSVDSFLPIVETFAVHEVSSMDIWIIQSASALSQSSNLHSLTLYRAGLTCHGASSLFKSLRINNSVKTLNISRNPELCNCSHQYEEVGFWLESMLSMNKSITKIQMYNALNDWLAQFLIAGVLKNDTLKSLDVDNNILTIDTIQGVIDASLNYSEIAELCIEGYVLHKSGLTLEESLYKSPHSRPKLFCALNKFSNWSSSASINDLCLGKDLKTSTLVRVLQTLQCNTSVKKLNINLSDCFMDTCNESLVGCVLKRLLLVNNVLEELTCTPSDVVCKNLADGLSKNTSLQSLSLKVDPTCSNSSIVDILKALQQNYSLQKLKIEFKNCQGSSSITDNGCDSEMVGSTIEEYLRTNSTLLELSLKISEIIAFRVAKGLLMNKCLKKLKVSLYSLVSFGVAELLLSLHSSTLSEVVIAKICSLHRRETCEWDLVIHSEYLLWQQIQYIHQKQPKAGEKLQIKSLKLFTNSMSSSFEVDRVLTDAALNIYQHLKLLDFSDVHESSYYDDTQFLKGKTIGIAFEKLLTRSSSIETLTFNSCQLPEGVWRYVGKALRVNTSIKILNLSEVDITINDAVSILNSLQVNQTLQELDLSKNLKLKDDSSSLLSNAIENALLYNTSLQNLNLKNSLSDDVAKKLAIALLNNTNIRNLQISQESLNYFTIQQFLLLLDHARPRNLHIQFDEALLNNYNEEHWRELIKKIGQEHIRWTSQYSYLESKLSKLFYGLCGFIYSQKRDTPILPNLTELLLGDVDCDAAIILFRTLAHTKSLSRLTKLSLKGGCCQLIDDIEVGYELKAMLVHNKTLHELALGLIGDTIVTSIADGLQHNCSLLRIIFSYTPMILNNFVIAHLLHSICKNVSLVEIRVSDIPLIAMIRANNSCWIMHAEQSYNSLLPHFVWCLCQICNGNVSPHSCVAETLLKSLSNVNLIDLDTKIAIKLFESLAFKSTCKELDISKNEKLLNSRNSSSLCAAIKIMLTNNSTLEILNISGSLNNTTAEGLVAGLEKNTTLRHLCIDANILKIELIAKIIHLIGVTGLVSLTITDIFILNKADNCQLLEINVIDELLWSLFVTILYETSPSSEMFHTFSRLTAQKCIRMGSLIRFDSACTELHVQFCTDDEFDGDAKDYHPARTSSIVDNTLSINSLKYLTLTWCNLTDSNCNYMITELLAKGMQLKKLDISHNSISACGMTELLNALKYANELEELDLSNNFDDEYFECHDTELGFAFETLLKDRSVPLKVLNVNHSKISDTVCINIGSGIQGNNTLLCLNLSFNNMTVTGIKALLQSLECNNCLRKVDVSGNFSLTEDACVDQTLYKVLKNNKSLTTLEIDCDVNSASIPGMFSTGIAQNLTLTKVLLNFTTCDLWELKGVRVYYIDCFSLILSRLELKMLISSTTSFSKNFELMDAMGLTVSEVLVSKLSEFMLDFKTCNLTFSHLKSIVQSLQENKQVLSLSLDIRDDFTQSQMAVLGSVIKTLLVMNSTMKHLELCGAIDDQIANGVKEGIADNHSIEQISLEVGCLTDNSILDLLLFLKSMQINQIKLYPKIELSKLKAKETSYWKWNTCNDQSLVCLSQVGRISDITMVQKFNVTSDIDDALAVSLFCCFEDNGMTSQITILNLYYRILDNAGENVSHALEKMIKKNSTLQQLKFTKPLNDSMALAIARGLLENHTLQRFDLNIACLSDEVLSQLLQSLSYTPLVIICRHTRGQILSFIRYNSTSLSQQMIRNSGSCRQSLQLGRVLRSISERCSLQELVICSSWQYLQHRIVRSGLQEMLKACTTLKVLKFDWPITVSIVKGLAAGLVGNKTLCNLKVNKRGLRMSNFKPIFMSLRLCALTRLEFIDEFALLREPESTSWEIVVLQSVIWENRLYQKLCEIYRSSNIKINTITHLTPKFNNFNNNIKVIEVWIPTVNIELVRILMRSIGAGKVPVHKLILNSVIDGSDLGIGPDVEAALKCKSLEKLRVNSDTQLITSLLIQSIFKLDFTTSTVCCIEIGNDILLERKERVFYNFDRDDHDNFKTVECREITPWTVTVTNNDILEPLFVMLKQICPSHSCLCHSVLHSLNHLDFGNEHSTVTSDESVNSSTKFQHDKNVAKLNLPYNSSDIHDIVHSHVKTSILKQLHLSETAMTKTAHDLSKGLTLYSSLKSLSLDIDVHDYGFDMIEELAHSFVNSDLNQLEIKDVCILHRNCDSCFVNLKQPSSVLHSWSLLVVLLAIHRHIPDLKLFLFAGVSDGLPLKIFQKLFLSLKEIHLELTVQGRVLFISVIELLQASTALTHLNFSYDVNLSILDEQSLGCAFEKLLLCNISLELINFTGQLGDEIVVGIARGLMHNATLQSLQLKIGLLTISTIASLFESVHASRLINLHITDGCTIHRNHNHYDVQFSGDKLLLCKLFCASVQAQNCHMGLQETLAPGGKLDLAQAFYNQNVGSTLPYVFTAVEEGNVSELILSGCDNLTSDIFASHTAIRDLLLSRTSKLQVLQLHRCHISDSDCKQIACGLTTNEQLKTLDLSSNKITSCGVSYLFESLLNNYTLQELDISNNDLSVSIKEQKDVSEVNARFSVLHFDICNSLCEHMAAGLARLRVLSMEIKEEIQAMKILKSLECNRSIKKLDLSNSSVNTSLVSSALGQLLACNYTLKELILHHCNISDEVFDLITEGLAQNNHLTKLDLSKNWLCGKGILALFKCLENDRSYLSELDLSSNHDLHSVDIVSFSEIKTNLANNTRLKALKVSDWFCCVSKGFQRELFKGLQQNSTLKELDISENDLDASTTRAFSDMLSRNTSLVKLNIRWCTFTPWNLENLARSLTQNPNCRVISDSLTKITLDLSDECVSNIDVSMEDQLKYDYHHVCGH